MGHGALVLAVSESGALLWLAALPDSLVALESAFLFDALDPPDTEPDPKDHVLHPHLYTPASKLPGLPVPALSPPGGFPPNVRDAPLLLLHAKPQ